MKNFKKFYKKNWLILTILILGVFLRIMYLDDSYIFWDESIYLMHGKVLTNQPVGYTEDFRPPLLPLLIAPFAFFPGYYVILSKIFMVLINSILIILIYFFGKQFSKPIGLLSAFLTSILPYHLMSSSWVMTDGPATVFLLITLLLYFRGFKQNKNNLICWGGFFLSLAILMKFPNFLLLILLLPLIIFNFKKIKTILKSFLVSLLTLSPYLLFNCIYFDNPLHGILKAFKIGNAIIATVGLKPLEIITKVFYDFFGIILSLLIFAGLLLFIKKEIFSQKNKKVKKENIFWVYCFFIFILYYIYTVHEGHTPIWWDTQRFLLSFLPFGLLFSTYFISKMMNNFSSRYQLIIIGVFIALVLLSWNQQYARFIQPAISHEDGLRHVTKELGLYLKGEDIDSLSCLGNCPTIAYYSNKKLSVVYDIKDFESIFNRYGIIFSDDIEKLNPPYEKAKTFCEGRWCAYLLKKPEIGFIENK